MAKSAGVAIKFGTDGWRGVIAEDFTDENIRIVAHAIARYAVRAEKPGSGIVVGYDTRFGSERFARVAAEAELLRLDRTDSLCFQYIRRHSNSWSYD